MKKLCTKLLFKISCINWLLVSLTLISIILLKNYTIILICFSALTFAYCFFSKKIVELILLVSLTIIFSLAVTLNTTKLTGSETLISGHIISIPTENEDYYQFELKTSINEKILVNIPNDIVSTPLNLKPGQVLFLEGELQEVYTPRVPNIFNYKKHLQNKKIYWKFKTKTFVVSNQTKLTPTILSYYVNNYLDKTYNQKTTSYLKALLLGDKTEISNKSYEAVSIVGIMHLFTVSGLHINLIIFYLLFIMKLLRFKNIFRYVVILSFLMLYILVLNFSPSVLRASLFYIWTLLLKKHKVSNIQKLALTFCTVFLLNPLFIYSISFIFTFLITFSLLLIAPLIKNKAKITKLFIASFTATITSFPVMSYFFYTVNINSFLANILFGLLVSLILLPASLITLIVPYFEFIYSFIINIFESFLYAVSSFSFNHFIVGKLPITLILVYYFLLFIVYIKLKSKKFVFSFLLLFLTVSIIFIFKYSNIYTEITMIDVGQGDSFLIRDKFNRCNMLIDTGGSVNDTIGKYTLLPYMNSLGISALDYLVISHADFDHYGESEYLIENYKVKNIILNKYENLEKIENLLNLANRYYVNVYMLEASDYFMCGSLTFNVLSPSIDYLDSNENSLVLHTFINNKGWLFTGDASTDIEETIIEQYPNLIVDILKIGHHGSNTSTSNIFLNHYKPKYALISSGVNNRYGHPTNEVISSLNKYNITIYRTDEMMTVRYRYGLFKDKWIFM